MSGIMLIITCGHLLKSVTTKLNTGVVACVENYRELSFLYVAAIAYQIPSVSAPLCVLRAVPG